jgi:hypothetical protein
VTALRQRSAALLGQIGLDTLLATVRFSLHNEEALTEQTRAGRPVIFLLWHGRLIPLSYFHRQRGYATLISQSADGESIARIGRAWGYHVVRGSSSRGGSVGLRALVRHVRAGRCLAITPDGPRGPMQRMKPGALLAAQLSGAPLLPLGAAADRAWWFGSWDRFLVPQPFARVHIVYGEPIHVPREIDDAAIDDYSRRAEDAINRVTRAADEHARR